MVTLGNSKGMLPYAFFAFAINWVSGFLILFIDFLPRFAIFWTNFEAIMRNPMLFFHIYFTKPKLFSH